MSWELRAACAVRIHCLDYVLSQDERYGVWGGLNEHELRRERRRRAARRDAA